MGYDEEEIREDADSEFIGDGEHYSEIPKKQGNSMLLIIIQLIVSVIIIIAALIIKFIGGTVHSEVATWFYDNYNNSIFLDTADSILPFTDNISLKETSTPAPDMEIKDNEDIIAKLKKCITKPLESAVLTSGYGNREYGGEEQSHKGIDLGADKGTEIYAAFDGTVTISQEDSTYGNYIVLSHDDGVKTLYAHCSKLLVKKGDKVKAGDKIALVGATGDADGNHLHFEVLIDGENIDPSELVDYPAAES